MKTLTFKINKGGQTFTITHKQNGFGTTFVLIEGSDLFGSDGKKKDKIYGMLKDEKIKFRHAYFLYDNQKFDGFKIDESVCQQIKESILEDKLIYENEKKDRQANRIPSYIDIEKFEVFDIGCDTGFIYHENKEAIKLAIKSGAIRYNVFRGQRDKTNKYPGQMDDFIPFDYVSTNEDGKNVAKGYDYVYPEHYCIEKKYYEKAAKQIEDERKLNEIEKNKILESKFEKAKKTNIPVLISKVVVAEVDTPLMKDDENDLVDVCQMAMPDGSIKEMYFHNY